MIGRVVLLGRTTRLLAALAAVAVVSCAPGDTDGGPTPAAGPLLKASGLRSLVLQPEDVGPAFLRFDEGEQGAADAPSGARADPQRFGRQGGWKARYRQSDRSVVTGPLVIESRADVFASPDGAAQDLAAYRSQLERDADETGVEMLEVEPIGDEAVASELLQASPDGGVHFFTIAWRSGNATASVTVQGFEDEVSLADAEELAVKQQERIDAAASTPSAS